MNSFLWIVTNIEGEAGEDHQEEAICCPTTPTAGKCLSGGLYVSGTKGSLNQ